MLWRLATQSSVALIPETGHDNLEGDRSEALDNRRDATELHFEEFPLQSAGQPLVRPRWMTVPRHLPPGAVLDTDVFLMPRKIRQLIADLERAGFSLVSGGRGSHRKFRHARFPGSVILSGGDGGDAHHYQEKQVRQAVRKVHE